MIDLCRAERYAKAMVGLPDDADEEKPTVSVMTRGKAGTQVKDIKPDPFTLRNATLRFKKDLK